MSTPQSPSPQTQTHTDLQQCMKRVQLMMLLLLVGVLGLLFCWRWNFCCCRVGIKLPTLQVRYENLSIDAKCLVGNRALPTLKNATLNFMEVHQPFFLGVLWIPLQDGIHGSWIHDSSLLAPAFCFRSCSLTTTMTTTSIHSSHYDEAAPFSPHFITTTIPVVVVVVFCLSADQSVWKPPSTPFLLLILKHISQTPFSSNSQFCKNPEGDRDQRECLCHMSWELRRS